MKKTTLFLCFTLLLSAPQKTHAWGAEGHAIIAKLAMSFVKDDVRKNVLAVLGNMSVDTAANWMDIMRSNPDYDFMKPWHYVDFPKGTQFVPSHDENIVSRLLYTYRELQHKNTICSEQVKTDLMVLLHLMGDLHMPLHNGYDEDLGGNKVMVQYDTMKTHNLHRFWDEDIIRLTSINYDQLLLLSRQPAGNANLLLAEVDFLKWMNDSRGLLDKVYDFPGFILNEAYLQRSKIIVEQQLIVAARRLALVLDNLFTSPAAQMDFTKAISQYKNGIPVTDASQNVGKKVSTCATVNSIRSTEKITQINVGTNKDNALVVIIFGSNYKAFPKPPAEMYKDKNICVTGKVETYRDKLQIIVEDPKDIVVQE